MFNAVFKGEINDMQYTCSWLCSINSLDLEGSCDGLVSKVLNKYPWLQVDSNGPF